MLKYHPEGPGEEGKELTIDFTPPWPRIPMVEGLEVGPSVDKYIMFMGVSIDHTPCWCVKRES